jgi:beta-galactosidase
MKSITMMALWVVSSMAGEQPAMMSHPFNRNWQFAINTASSTVSTVWQDVALPHTARLESVLPGNQMWMGDCLYRKVFLASPEWKGKRVCLNIEAAMHTAEVLLNGKRVTSHAGGYLPFQADLSGQLVIGSTNELLIKLDNRENPDIPPGRPYSKLDFNWYHGLYRNVDLQVTDPLHMTDPVAANLPATGGIFVTYPSVSPDAATVQIRVHVKNDRAVLARFTVRCSLAGKTVQSAPAALAPGESDVYTLALVVPEPMLWSPDTPHLYPLTAELRTMEGVTVESQCLRVGIRSVTCKAGQFVINGRAVYLRGTNRHQEYPYIGYALPDSAQWRDAALIKQAGFDLVRLSHYPNSSAFLDACDYYGIVVMEPIPGWQFYKDGLFAERSLQTARDMIRRDRNHPACIFWETSLNEARHPDAFLKQLHEIVGQEYPGAISASHINKFHDVFIPARQHTNGPKFWDEWKQGDKPIFTAEYGDWEYYADNAANFNQTGIKELRGEEVNSRQKRSDGEKRMVQQALNFQESHNQNHACSSMIGDANWLFNDYSRGCAPDHCTSGIVDVFRLPKFVYYFYESQRDPTEGALANPGVFIASYWTAQSPLPVRVFSNGDEVELLLNGVSLGRRKPDQDRFSRNLAHAPFTFPVTSFQPGELKAIAYIGGKRVVEHVVRTPGKPERIRLVARLSGIPISRNSKDAFFVHAEIVDCNGTLIPDAAFPVNFVATGAELASPEHVDAEAGIASALLLTAGTDRSIVIKATSLGIESDSLILK